MPRVALAGKPRTGRGGVRPSDRIQALKSEEDPVVVVGGHVEASGIGCSQPILDVDLARSEKAAGWRRKGTQ